MTPDDQQITRCVCFDVSFRSIIEAGDAPIQCLEVVRPGYALDASSAARLEIYAASADSTAGSAPSYATDLHAFQRGEVLALYFTTEIESDLLAEHTAALLATFEQRVQDAVEGAR